MDGPLAFAFCLDSMATGATVCHHGSRTIAMQEINKLLRYVHLFFLKQLCTFAICCRHASSSVTRPILWPLLSGFPDGGQQEAGKIAAYIFALFVLAHISAAAGSQPLYASFTLLR